MTERVRKVPRTPAEINSPINIVMTKKITLSSSINIYFSTKGIITVLETIVGRGDNHLYFRRRYAPTAPISVANEPKMISITFPEVRRFARAQPRVTPGIAADVKQGRMQSASEIRHWITPEASPKTFESRVRATYIAAIIADVHIYLILLLKLTVVVLLFFIIKLLSFVFREDGYELTFAKATRQVYHKIIKKSTNIFENY